jgi:hypothetical protein
MFVRLPAFWMSRQPMRADLTWICALAADGAHNAASAVAKHTAKGRARRAA